LDVPIRKARRVVRGQFDSPRKPGRRDDERLTALCAFLLEPGSNCIDIGASYGGVLHTFTHYAPKGHHIAFEPVPDVCAQLRDRYPNVDVRQVALSNDTGTATFVVVDSLTTRSGFRRVTYPGAQKLREILVETAKLDDLLPADYIPTLIKIDVEGAEMQVFEGAREALLRHRPIVVFEHQHWTASHYGIGPDDVHRFLCDDLEMRIYDMLGKGPYGREQFVTAYNHGKPINFVARP
jgi:FkbM family methyltransferase